MLVGDAIKSLQLELLEESYYVSGQTQSTSQQIIEYEKSFTKSLPIDVKESCDDTLRRAIDLSSVCIFGDFHSSKKFQQNFLKYFLDWHHLHSSEDAVICLEAIPASYQKEINKFLQDDISEKEFLDRSRFRDQWGFPWDNMREIFLLAKQHGIKIFGVNCSRNQTRPITETDLEIAKTLSSIQKVEKPAKIFVLIGEFHLANHHLPEQINKQIPGASIARIIFDHEKYFLKRLASPTPFNCSKVFEIEPHFFCVYNNSPWLKWKTHEHWLETLSETTNFDSDADLDEFETNVAIDSLKIIEFSKKLAAILDLDTNKTCSHPIYVSEKRRDVFNSIEIADFLSYRPDRNEHTIIRPMNLELLLYSSGFHLVDSNSNFSGHQKFLQRTAYILAANISAFLLDFNRYIIHADEMEKSCPNFIKEKCRHIRRTLAQAGTITQKSKLEKVDFDHHHMLSKILGQSLACDLFRNHSTFAKDHSFLARFYSYPSAEDEVITKIFATIYA